MVGICPPLPMTPFHQQFFSNNYEIIHDLNRDRFIMPMFKCGSSSIIDWAKKNSFPIYTDKNSVKFEEVEVYWKEPIARYWSGTKQTFKNLNLENKKDFEKILEQNYFLDPHQMPQFWFLLKLVNKCGSKIKFKFLDLNNLSEITLLHENKTIESTNFNLSQYFNDKLNLYMTPDIVIWNEMINKTLTFDEILNRISKEEEYVRMAQKYTFYNGILSWQNHSTFQNLEKA